MKFILSSPKIFKLIAGNIGCWKVGLTYTYETYHQNKIYDVNFHQNFTWKKGEFIHNALKSSEANTFITTFRHSSESSCDGLQFKYITLSAGRAQVANENMSELQTFWLFEKSLIVFADDVCWKI